MSASLCLQSLCMEMKNMNSDAVLLNYRVLDYLWFTC